MPFKVSFPGTGGLLQGTLFKPPRFQNAVVVLHGFRGYRFSSNKRGWMHFLEQAGYLALTFDFFAHGKSEGSIEDLTVTQELEDVEMAVRYLRKNYSFGKLALIGHSMGGTVAELYASRHQKKTAHKPVLAAPAGAADVAANTSVDAVVAVSAPLYFSKYPDKFHERKDVEAWEKNGVLTIQGFGDSFDLKYAFKKDQLSYDVATAVKALSCPKLFLHGTLDELVPFQESVDAYALAKEPKRLKLLEGDSHSLERRSREALAEILSFLKEFV